MNIVERKAAPGKHTHLRCEAAGCSKSGRYIATFLGGYDTRLCASCRIEWAKAWDSAKSNWADEFKDAA